MSEGVPLTLGETIEKMQKDIEQLRAVVKFLMLLDPTVAHYLKYRNKNPLLDDFVPPQQDKN